MIHISTDPDRPKNDKATIINDTIQVLKDLTTEVNRLKAECAALSEESREVSIFMVNSLVVANPLFLSSLLGFVFKQLTQEKNELREEKATLKSDVDNLNVQYQQRMRVMFPWGTIDPSAVMAPPYSYPVPIPVPTGPIPMHPVLQPFPFFQNQNPGAIPTPYSTLIPYPGPPNHPMDQPSYQCASTSRVSSKQDSESKTSDHCTGSIDDKSDDSNDVVTELELKMPGSKAQQVSFRGCFTKLVETLEKHKVLISLNSRKDYKNQNSERHIAEVLFLTWLLSLHFAGALTRRNSGQASNTEGEKYY